MKNSDYGKRIAEFIALNKDVKVGDKYADFTQNNVNGESVSLWSFTGNVILLEFWGSWCVPCRKGHPELVKIYDEFKVKGLKILGVAADSDRQAWLEAVRKDSLTWENMSDLEGDRNKAALIYGIDSYPSII